MSKLQRKRYADAMWLYRAVKLPDRDRSYHQMKLMAEAADRRTEKRKGR